MRIGIELNPGVNFLFQKNATIVSNYHFAAGMNFRYQF